MRKIIATIIFVFTLAIFTNPVFAAKCGDTAGTCDPGFLCEKIKDSDKYQCIDACQKNKAGLYYKPNITIPGMKNFFNSISVEDSDGVAGKYFCGYFVEDDSLGNYINVIYNYAIGIVGIISTIVLMWGGFSWIIAGGNAERVGNAKSWISAALTGLVLTFTSYLILSTINSNLVNFNTLIIPAPISQTSNTSENSCDWRETNQPLNNYCSDLERDGWIKSDNNKCSNTTGTGICCCQPEN